LYRPNIDADRGGSHKGRRNFLPKLSKDRKWQQTINRAAHDSGYMLCPDFFAFGF
jgi:hypothetical protein